MVVSAMLSAGAGVDIESHDGRTALHRAANWKRLGPLDQVRVKSTAYRIKAFRLDRGSTHAHVTFVPRWRFERGTLKGLSGAPKTRQDIFMRFSGGADFPVSASFQPHM